MRLGFTTVARRTTGLLALWLGVAAAACAEPLISEFLAANSAGLADEDGASSDWIEIHNPDAASADLTGWALTDSSSNKLKWRFPAVALPAGGYLVVFASNKDRRDPARALHTNFALDAGGEYLALVRPDGSVASEFSSSYPPQTDNVSYGRAVAEDGTALVGFFPTPTPGAPNGLPETAPLAQSVAFSRAPGLFSTPAIVVQLAGAAEDQVIRFTLATGAGAAAAEPTADSPLYQGPLVLTGTATLRAAVFSADGSARGAVTSAHYAKLDADLAGFSSRLPVLVLDDLGAGPLEKDGVDHPSWLFAFKPASAGGFTFGAAPELVTPLVTTVRGSSSADFPKKGYNVKLRDERGRRRALPLVDLPAYERWALVAPWAFDPSFVNNAFVYDLSNRLGRWAPRTRLVEVFFNSGGDALGADDYAGIYIVTDRIRIDRGRVDLATLSPADNAPPAVTGGYIFKIDAKDDDEAGWTTARGVPEASNTALVPVEPDASGVTAPQLAYLQGYVQRMEDALHADRADGFAQRTYLDYLDRGSWVDHHLLNVLVANPDALHRSAYFHKNRGGRIAAGPVWDFDRALGGFWDDRTSVVDTWSGTGPGVVDVWRTGWWGVLAEDPEFVQDWIDRWQSLRTAQLSTASLAALFQSHANALGVDAAARDVARWPDSASPHGGYEAQVAHVKDWLARRTAWIDAQFVARPIVTVAGGSVTFSPPPGATLAYTLDGSDPRARGGELAPNALTSDEPLTVSGESIAHVRAYDRSRAGAPPASAWSSAVGTAAANPLAPSARLANVSVRATIESDDTPVSATVNVADTDAKTYLVRAIGPGLAAFGSTQFAAQPRLRVTDAAGHEIQRNAGWQTGADPARLVELAKAVGAFPLAADSADSALAVTHPAGRFSAHVTAGDAPGHVLLELYPIDSYGRTVGVAARALVRGGEPLVAGFVVQGPAHKRLLFRALGPGLPGADADWSLQALELILAAGTRQVAANDDWNQSAAPAVLADAARRLRLAPLSAEHADAALLVTLAPGSYTVEIRAKPDAGGVAQLEVHDLP